MYIWQANNWPNFVYQDAQFEAVLEQILELQKRLIGQTKDIPPDIDREAEMDALIQNALRTSEIEGEILDIGSVRSSVAKQLGIDRVGFPVGRPNGTRQTESLVAMLSSAMHQLDTPLTQATICEWQAALFPETPIVRDVVIGDLRGDTVMQVVSQQGRKERVHFEAPPRDKLQSQLNNFYRWFNENQQKNTTSKQAIIRAAIAHLWLITLHPFDDGNGRVVRALTDRALAQAEKTSIRFYSLSAAIEANRESYYDILETVQSCESEHQIKNDNHLDITAWMVWFMDVLVQALQVGNQRIERVLKKAQFWKYHSQTILSKRQVKVLNRLLDNAGEEFIKGINASKYQSLAKVSKATATRDLSDLVMKDCLSVLPAGGRSTRYIIAAVLHH